MSNSKFVKPNVTVAEKETENRCDFCGKKLSSKGAVKKHVKYACPKIEHELVECQFCQVKTSPVCQRDHVRRFHPERLEEFEVMSREMTEDNQKLAEMILEMGDPGGEREVREGCEFLFDKEYLVIRYSVEEVDPACIGTPRERGTFHWYTDKFLPKKLRLNYDSVPGGYLGWHFAHVICYSYHNFDAKRKATVTASSVGCVQHQVVNLGVWSQLESSFKFLSLKYRTFVWSGTVIGKQPITHESKERKDGKYKVAKKSVGVPEYLFKIAVVKDQERGWLYDSYLIKNDESSTMSPNGYRKDLDVIRERSGFTFLGKLRKVQQAELYDEGNTLKWQWIRDNPNRYDADIAEKQSVAESGFAEDEGLRSDSEVDEDVSELDPKDIRIRDLEAENASLKDRIVNLQVEKAELLAENIKLRAQRDVDGKGAKRQRSK